MVEYVVNSTPRHPAYSKLATATLVLLCAGVGLLIASAPLQASLLGAGLTAAWFCRRDPWRGALGLTVLLMAGAASRLDGLPELVLIPKFGMAATLALTSAFGNQQLPGPSNHRLHFLIGLLGLFAGLAAISTVWSSTPGVTFQHAILWILLVVLCYGAATRRWTEMSVLFSDLLVIFWTLTATFSIGFGLDFLEGLQWNRRLSGLYINPNMAGLLALTATGIGWGLYKERRQKIILVGLAICLLTLMASQSRTAILALVATALWLAIRSGISGLARGLSITLLVASIGFLFYLHVGDRDLGDSPVVDRFSIETGGSMLGGRLEYWSRTLDLWSDRPILGYGFRSTAALATSTDRANLGSIHNAYLQTLLELGLLGAFVFLGLNFALLSVAFRAPVNGISAGLVFVVAAGLLSQLGESATLGTGQAMPWLFWPLGAAATSAIGSVELETDPLVRRKIEQN